MSLKRELIFTPQSILVGGPTYNNIKIADNIIRKTDIPELKWLEDSTTKIGHWRGIFRSVYIRWALSINGLHVANEKYTDTKFKKEKSFTVSCYRQQNTGLVLENLVNWDGDTAGRSHLETINMLASYGIIDLYSCLEDFILDFYKIYLRHNPNQLLKGPENRSFRAIYSSRASKPDEWSIALEDRLKNWQRKKIYEGLDRVFLSFYGVTGLKKPSRYTLTTPETWAENIKGISILRNYLIHGERIIGSDLADLSKKPYFFNQKFKIGEEIILDTSDLMSTELFLDQLLTAINMSMIEFGN